MNEKITLADVPAENQAPQNKPAHDNTTVSFDELGLKPALLKAITDSGYEQPSPIQQQAIPAILSGRDVLGQAQTGTGKTAAFALPILSRLDPDQKSVQVLVLTPTRELAIQVAEAFQTYARHLPDFHVLPIYGGQSFSPQLRQLKRGVHVVVGTPGRIMDHMRRGTLKLDNLRTLVLDEADEMLRMGFIDDVDWILGHTPKDRQIALFSATMPPAVKKVAVNHLYNPLDIKVASKTTTAKNIEQRYWLVSGLHKLDALTRLLETEDFDAALVFVRTKMATEELAEKLKARGFAAEALNGDVQQKQREKLVSQLKKGQIDILVGTDVVARGLDVDRISHVINYDIPHDVESYVHRIGRTGRAGRSGQAILFVARREQRMLRDIERVTKQRIAPMKMPSVADVNLQRMHKFKERIADTLASKDLGIYQQLVREFQTETDTDPAQIAAALAYLAQDNSGVKLVDSKTAEALDRANNGFTPASNKAARGARANRLDTDTEARPLREHPEIAMQRFALNAGHQHGVKPANIVGMIANEIGMDSKYIGHIDIHDEFTTVDLPADMPKEVLSTLKKARIAGRKSLIAPLAQWHSEGRGFTDQSRGPKGPHFKSKKKGHKPFKGKGRKNQ